MRTLQLGSGQRQGTLACNVAMGDADHERVAAHRPGLAGPSVLADAATGPAPSGLKELCMGPGEAVHGIGLDEHGDDVRGLRVVDLGQTPGGFEGVRFVEGGDAEELASAAIELDYKVGHRRHSVRLRRPA